MQPYICINIHSQLQHQYSSTDLNSEVDDFQASDGLWSAQQRSQRVEEWLKDHPQQLCESVIEQTTFKM